MTVRTTMGEVKNGRVLETTDTTVTARRPGILSALFRYGPGATVAGLITAEAVHAPEVIADGAAPLIGVGLGAGTRRATQAIGRHLPEGLRRPLNQAGLVAAAVGSGLLGNEIDGVPGVITSVTTSVVANAGQGKLEQWADGITTATMPLARQR